MAAVIKDIKLDFLEENNVVVLAKQEDAGSRFIRVAFAEEGKPFPIAGASYVTLNVKKNDGHVVKSEGIVNDDGTATVPLISQMLAVDGDAKADVSVFGIEPKKLTTMSFTVRVQESSIPDGTEISTDEFNDLITALAEIAGFAGVRDEVEDARGTYGTVEERLDDVDADLYTHTGDIASLGGRLTTAEQSIGTLDSGLTGALQRITDNEEDISALETDKVDKTSQATKDNAQDVQLSMLTQQLADANKTIANMSDGRVTVDGGYGNVSALPKTAAIAAMNSILYGNLLTNETTYNRTTWAEWTKPTGVTADITGLTITSERTSLEPSMPTNLKPSTKYGIVFNILTNTMTENVRWGYRTIGTYQLISTGAVGNYKSVLTTQASIVSNKFEIGNGTTVAGVFKAKDFRIFELPAGSVIETHFNTLTADQLDAIYPYIDGTQSAQVTCIEATGKNLFDGKLESGDISTTKGLNITEGTRARAINRIRTTATAHYITLPTGYRMPRLFFYSDTGAFLSFTSYDSSGSAFTFTPPVGTAFIRLTFRNPANTTITAADIESIKAGCIVSLGSTATSHEAFKLTEQYIEPYNLRSHADGTTDTIDTAKNEYIKRLDDSGVKLAEPIITQGIVTGNILSRPNGTIQFCNKHSYTSMVVDGKLPTRTWYADIGTVERLEKFNSSNNTWTLLDVSTATIAVDKRSISHPQLANGDIARCKYAYTFGGVNGRKDISYVAGANLVTDSVTGTVYKVGKAIADGVMTDTMTEVV